jgi:predicted small lipoprotein YifL
MKVHMLAIAVAMVVLSVLTGCGLPVPANSGPCQVAPGSQECQIWIGTARVVTSSRRPLVAERWLLRELTGARFQWRAT